MADSSDYTAGAGTEIVAQNKVDGNPDIRFIRRSTLSGYTQAATDKLGELFSHPGKLSLWDKTVGSLADLKKSPVSSADNKAIAAPLIEGILNWTRDEDGKPVRMDDIKAIHAQLDDEAKRQIRLRKRLVRSTFMPAPCKTALSLRSRRRAWFGRTPN